MNNTSLQRMDFAWSPWAPEFACPLTLHFIIEVPLHQGFRVLKLLSKKRHYFQPSSFYTGQQIKGKKQILENKHTIHCNKDMNPNWPEASQWAICEGEGEWAYISSSTLRVRRTNQAQPSSQVELELGVSRLQVQDCVVHRLDNTIYQAPVFQKVDSSIHWVNLCPVDNTISFCNTYPLDSYYPVDSAIPLFNNQGQINFPSSG